MTDKQIMQALNCCTSKSISCQKCPLLGKSKCERELIQYSFEIINRQQAEIDELNNFANERLDKFTERYDRNLRAEAIKEFAEKLKRKAYRFPCAIGTEYAVPIRAINEMAGDEE